MNKTQKKGWATPALKVHGSVEQITQQVSKQVGPDDGLVLITNAPISVGS